ncbi:MAG: aspartate ammonia-lyase [Frankiales bacterium]|nr:aspartate ammonia-lyase [Frankiales bacterium]
MTDAGVRREQDSLGQLDVPANAYWGAHTQRALANFPITGTPLNAHPDLVRALAAVKEAAASANYLLGELPEDRADAIATACREIRGDALHDQFVVDVLQGGAGTSTNMNANEVIANRALEILGHQRGEYVHCSPLDDVNRSQSTNDAYPTAVRIALITAVDRLRPAITALTDTFRAKATEFADVVKVGRTQLQDAVLMTCGQEFGAFATALSAEQPRLVEARRLLCEVNLGGTAIGTSMNVDPRYPALVRERLVAITGLPVRTAADLVEATSDTGALVHLSGVLKRLAVTLSKVCNDLRLLASGPYAGMADITLPAVQAGSSMMPGKVNPVIPEAVNQVAFEVIGLDVTVTMAAQAAQLQLNAFEPVMVHSLLLMTRHLDAACRILAERCVAGITVDRAHASDLAGHSLGIVTALVPHIGYAAAADVAHEAAMTGASAASIVVQRGLLTAEQMDIVLRAVVPQARVQRINRA